MKREIRFEVMIILKLQERFKVNNRNARTSC